MKPHQNPPPQGRTIIAPSPCGRLGWGSHLIFGAMTQFKVFNRLLTRRHKKIFFKLYNNKCRFTQSITL